MKARMIIYNHNHLNLIFSPNYATLKHNKNNLKKINFQRYQIYQTNHFLQKYQTILKQ
jgi:hypothetical protein